MSLELYVPRHLFGVTTIVFFLISLSYRQSPLKTYLSTMQPQTSRFIITTLFLVCFGDSVAGRARASQVSTPEGLTLLIALFTAQSDAGYTIDMLNAMQRLMTGDAEFFDPVFLEELLQVSRSIPL